MENNNMLKDIEVRKTKNLGFGLFAVKPFSRGDEIIDIAYGRILTIEQCGNVPPEISQQLDRKDENHYYFMTYPEYYINHGCEPNVYQKNGGKQQL
jgi:ribosome maturation factor RimP